MCNWPFTITFDFPYSVADKTVKEYSVYKPFVAFFALVDGLYQYVFKVSLS